MTKKKKTWLSIGLSSLVLFGVVAPIVFLTTLKSAPTSEVPINPPAPPKPEPHPQPVPPPQPTPPITPPSPPSPPVTPSTKPYRISFNHINSFPYGDINVAVSSSSIDINWVKNKVLEHKTNIFVFDAASLPRNFSWEDNLSIDKLAKQDTSLSFEATLKNANEKGLSIKNTISFNNFKPNPVAPSYTVKLDDLKTNYELMEPQTINSSLTPANDEAYYEWSCNDPDLKIMQNNKSQLIFKSNTTKNYHVLLKVYDSPSKKKTLASDTFIINTSQMYGYSVSKNSLTFDFLTTDEAVDLNTALNQVKSYMTKKLNETNVKQYLDAWAQSYINDIVASRNHCVTGAIESNSLVVNSDLSISGSIKFSFTWTKEMQALLVPEKRNVNDVEHHTYVFNRAKIEPYIDYAVNNKIGFKIIANEFQRKLNTTVPGVENYNLAFKNQKVLLTSMEDLSITFNNSLFNIDPFNFLETSYSYQRGSDDEKLFIKEVLTKLLHRQVQLLIAGDHPIRRGTSITSPIIQINLSRRYNISSDFLEMCPLDFYTLFYFINSSKISFNIRDNVLYIYLTGAVIHNVQPTSDNPLINVDYGTKYDKPYAGFQNVYDWFEDLPLIKTTLIKNVSSQITNKDWNAYIKSLSDTEKAEKIYAFLLPFVSYGQNGAYTGNTSGYIYKKLLCEGYASAFRYIASTLKITSLLITGTVKANAKPGQTAAGKHAWNLIKIDNDWLWCDPTWDDSISATSTTYNKDNFLQPTNAFFTPETHLNVDNWKNGSLLPIKVAPVK